jgi:3-oxoadipyl-CoA thiolase
MPEAVIVDALRTPMGRYGGALAPVRPDDLASYAIRALVERTGVDPETIDDVFWGAANQAGEDCRNVGRMATLLAGLPPSVPGTTLNRLCGSGLQALNSAFHAIAAGVIDVAVAGGAESMTRAPFVILKSERAYDRAPEIHDTTLGNRMVNPRLAAMYPPISLGETAEKVAEQFHVTREDQDRFAFESQQKCKAAVDAGRFAGELIPVHVEQGKKSYDVTQDEPPRPDTTMESLAKLKPAFKANGTVTAGNSSPLNDGAAALLICSAGTAERHGWEPLARVVTSATSGVDPSVMGIGPIGATRKALERAKLSVDALDLVELNEAFAAQSVACVKELGIDPSIVNVNGGAIALGHPLGCSGARIATTLLHEMKRRNARYGLATMCIGMGQGIATLFERV